MTEADYHRLQEMADQERWSDVLRKVNEHLQGDSESRTETGTRMLFLYRGSANMGLQRFREALSDFDTVMANGPESGTAWYLRGCCFLHLSNKFNGPEQVLLLRRCLIDLDEALFREPGHDRGKALRARIAPLVQEAQGASGSKSDNWLIAKKVAEVAGALLGSALK